MLIVPVVTLRLSSLVNACFLTLWMAGFDPYPLVVTIKRDIRQPHKTHALRNRVKTFCLHAEPAPAAPNVCLLAVN